MNTQQLLEIAIKAAYLAGNEILEVYNSEFAVEHKEDKSPLTLADKKSHQKITQYLAQTPYPVLSEEGRDIEYEERKKWEVLWIVDPLDGTKEFIKRNGEFTVNIALVQNQQPVLGVIYVPVKQVMYFAAEGIGSFKAENFQQTDDSLEKIMEKARKLPFETQTNGAFRVVGSRSHMSPETEEYIEKLKSQHPEIEIVSMGSSLKICLVAEGTANVYPRFAPTMEWDTAAGQAIARFAGKNVIDYTTGEVMKYNKENLLNNWFIVQ